MIIPIYAEDLFELITLAEIEQQFLERGIPYRMIPVRRPDEVLVTMPDDFDIKPEPIPIVEVMLEPIWRMNNAGERTKTWIGLTKQHELALRIRAAFAAGQRTYAHTELAWWRVMP